ARARRCGRGPLRARRRACRAVGARLRVRRRHRRTARPARRLPLAVDGRVRGGVRRLPAPLRARPRPVAAAPRRRRARGARARRVGGARGVRPRRDRRRHGGDDRGDPRRAPVAAREPRAVPARPRRRSARLRRPDGVLLRRAACGLRARARSRGRPRALRGCARSLAPDGPPHRVGLRPHAPMRLVALVLNWNGGEDTLRALESLAGIEAICVDNGSTDGSDAEVERRYPQVELIRNGANLGYAEGNNVGLRRALERGADWVLLVNDDAVAEPGVADALERAARARPDAGILACKILFEDGRTVMYAGASFNVLLGYSGRRDGFGRPDRFHELRDVARADGAAMALSRPLLERVGLLDAELFAYAEYVDLSLRARAAGFAIVFVPDAIFRHKGSASTGGSASTHNLYSDTRNTIVVCERLRPLPPGLRALRRGVVVGAHLVQAAAHPSRRAAARAVIEGWSDARAGRLGERRVTPARP